MEDSGGASELRLLNQGPIMGVGGVEKEREDGEEVKEGRVVLEEIEDEDGEREEVQEEKEEDLEAAEDGFDWIGDFFGEGIEDIPLRKDDNNSTSAKDTGGEDCRAIFTAATTATAAGRKTNTSGGDTEAEAEEEGMVAEDPARERHKAAERERRKSMRDLFLSLHALLPHGNSVRKEQSAILDEVIGYIPLAASRLRTLKSNLYQLQANNELQTGSAPPTSTDSNSGVSRRRISRQYSRYHPYSSSSCSSSSSTDYAHSNCAVINSDCQSPLPAMQLQQEQGRQNMDDDRHAESVDAAAYSINSGSSVPASATNNQTQLQLQIQPQQQQDEAPSSSSTVSSNTSDPLAPSVSVRVRGDRLSVSVIDTREPYTTSSSCSSHGLLTLSMVLDELEAHNLRLIRSTHCRDGTKLIHYSESKIPEEMEGTPTELKAKLQHLAHKLQLMRSTGNP